MGLSITYRTSLSSSVEEDNRKLVRHAVSGDELLDIHLVHQDVVIRVVSLRHILAADEEVAADGGHFCVVLARAYRRLVWCDKSSTSETNKRDE